jgi:hypothetical protein
MFSYISPVDVKINIPQSVLDWIENYEYAGKADAPKNISRQIDRLVHHINPGDEEFPMELLHKDQHVTLTLESYQEIKSVKLTALKYLGLSMLTAYSRIEFPVQLAEEMISNLPEVLQEFNPTPVLQIIDGEGMPPHSDFGRTSSLYFVLTGEECDTMWFGSNGKVNLKEYANKHGFFYSIANMEHVELRKTFNLIKNQWYVFDNQSYHAVKSKNGRTLRKGLQIEFNSLSASDLYNLLTK